MPRSGKGYAVHDGTHVPGVTTIIGRFEDKSGLIVWANKQGLLGVSTEDVRNEAFKDGKEVHYVFESVIKRRKIDIKPAYKKFADELVAFLKKLEIVDLLSEIALVSETHKFGGTPDLIVKTKQGETIVMDFKFSNYVGVAVAYQMAAYKILVEENLRRTVTRGMGIHLEKKKFKEGTSSIRLIEIGDLEIYSEAFLKMRELYDVVAETENRFKSEKG